MKTSTVFRRAAKVLDERGLYKGWFHDETPQGPVCFWGAANTAYSGHPSDEGDAQAVDFTRRVGLDSSDIVSFSDDPTTTKEEVIDALLLCSFLAADEEKAGAR